MDYHSLLKVDAYVDCLHVECELVSLVLVVFCTCDTAGPAMVASQKGWEGVHGPERVNLCSCFFCSCFLSST